MTQCKEFFQSKLCLCQNGTIIRIIGQVKHCPFNLLEVRNNKKVGSFLRWLENFHQIAEVFPTFLKKYIDCIRDYFRGERNSLAWEYYEGYFPFSHRLSANLILKSHKFHIFVIKHSVLGILHGNLSTHMRQLTPKITAFDKSK